MMAGVGIADRPAPAGGADRLGLPARLRRDAAADRPDRRPARPGPGAGRRAGACSPSARWSPRWPTTCPRMVGRPVPPGRRRRRPGARDARAGRRPLPRRAPRRPARRRRRPCRSSAASSARCSARWCSPSPTGGRSSSSTWPSGLVLAAAIRAAGAAPPAVERAAETRPPRLRRPALLLLVTLAAGPLVFVPSRAGCCATCTWGQAFVPFVGGDGRWLTPVGAGRPSRPPLLFLVRCPTARPAAGRPAPLGRGALREADLRRRAAAGRRAGRRDPGLRHRRPRGRRSSPTRARGTSSARAVAAVAVRAAPPPGRRARWSRTARCARTPAWGALLVSFFVGCRADRGARRHPDLRPHHRLPRLAAAGRAGAGAASWWRCRSARVVGRLPHPPARPPAWSPRSGWLLAAVGFV